MDSSGKSQQVIIDEVDKDKGQNMPVKYDGTHKAENDTNTSSKAADNAEAKEESGGGSGAREKSADEVLEGVISGVKQMSVKEPLQNIVEGIKNESYKNIIVMTGAGISTAAGIRDFRSPGTGLYDNLQKYKLASPEDIFTLRYFKKNPDPFYDLARELFKDEFQPTDCHYFLRLLDERGVLLRLFTQNIDGLETKAGIRPEKLVESHGHFRTGHCLACRKEYDEAWLREKVFKEKVIPSCACKGVVKPDITFFGENLPERFFQCIGEDFPRCDLLLIFGTSLTVSPFQDLVYLPDNSIPRVLVNSTPVHGFSEENEKRLLVKEYCDDGCHHIASLLGWEEDFNHLIKTAKISGNQTTVSPSEE